MVVAACQEADEDPTEEADMNTTAVPMSGTRDILPGEVNTTSSLTRMIGRAIRATAMSAAAGTESEGTGEIRVGTEVAVEIGTGNGMGEGRRGDMSVGGRGQGVRKRAGIATESAATAIGGSESVMQHFGIEQL